MTDVAGGGRFAPSPTGDLHVGNLRTALAAYLAARSDGTGRFCIRIDDLDPVRSQARFAKSQLADLALIGVVSDEVPIHQSQRASMYRDALEQLRRRENLYACYCTRAQMHEQDHRCSCARLSARERAEHERRGDPSAWKIATDRAVASFDDACFGPQRVRVDDFVVWRKDDVAAYHLACIIDDVDQGFTRIVRGADLLAATASQVWLADLLGLRRPSYAHVALLVDAQGRRLGKRHGSITLTQLAALGHDPDAVRGMLAASLGLCAAREHLTLDALVERFSITALPVKNSTWPADDDLATAW